MPEGFGGTHGYSQMICPMILLWEINGFHVEPTISAFHCSPLCAPQRKRWNDRCNSTIVETTSALGLPTLWGDSKQPRLGSAEMKLHKQVKLPETDTTRVTLSSFVDSSWCKCFDCGISHFSSRSQSRVFGQSGHPEYLHLYSCTVLEHMDCQSSKFICLHVASRPRAFHAHKYALNREEIAETISQMKQRFGLLGQDAEFKYIKKLQFSKLSPSLSSVSSHRKSHKSTKSCKVLSSTQTSAVQGSPTNQYHLIVPSSRPKPPSLWIWLLEPASIVGSPHWEFTTWSSCVSSSLSLVWKKLKCRKHEFECYNAGTSAADLVPRKHRICWPTWCKRKG